MLNSRYVVMFIVLHGLFWVNCGTVFAKDKLQLKDGYFIPADEKCEHIDSIIGSPDYTLSVFQNKGKLEGFGTETNFYEIRKVKKNGNQYTLSIDAKPIMGANVNMTLYEEKWLLDVSDESSFTLVRGTVMDKTMVNVQYKLCDKPELPKPQAKNLNNNTIAGNWSGELQMSNDAGVVITTKYSVIIYESKNKSGSYSFKESLNKKAAKPSVTFNCSGTNSYDASLEGNVVINKDIIKLVASSTSNPSCVRLGASTFKFNNNTLSNDNMDGTNIPVSLHRVAQ